MRKSFILIVLLAMACSSQAKSQGKELHDLLFSYMQVEDIHPDSLERNIADLKQRRSQLADPGGRAVYAAIIGRMYAARMKWRSVGTDLRDSAVIWYGRALADKQALARTRAKQWKPTVIIGKDEGYFGGDMLNVVWNSLVEVIDESVRDTSSVLPKYGDMIDYYRRNGNREAAFLLACDSLFEKGGVNDTKLLRLRDEYADLPLCAEIYLDLGTLHTLTPFQRREWLQEGIARYPHYKRKKALQNALTRMSNPTFRWSGPTLAYPGKEYKWKFSARNIQSVTIDGVKRDFGTHDPIEDFRDSMVWVAPKPGDYEIVFIPETPAKLEKKVEPLRQKVHVTALQMLYQAMPDDRVSVLVVDRITGRPLENVVISAYNPDTSDSVAYFAGQTDAMGRVSVPRWRMKDDNKRLSSRLRVKMSTPEETHLPFSTLYLYNNDWHGVPRDSTYNLQLFTDRAIYRPGQTVHVAGIEYNQLDWQARTISGRQHTLTLIDSQYKKVEEKETMSDEMGVFSTDFVIPEGCRNGRFSIRADNGHYVYFRVEEYKRPTFEVTLEDSLDVQGDSCIVHGMAKSYDGTPLRGARVTGTYHWMSPWFYYEKERSDKEIYHLDTITTDDNGRFQYAIKRKVSNYGPRHSLTVTVDVLSQQGETHNTSHWYWRPLEMPAPQPEKVDSTFLVRCEPGTFSAEKPGRINVTTTLSDVYLHYTLSAAGKVWKEDMALLSNETFTLDIPYKEEYDQSLTATFCFVKEGRVYTESKTIYLAKPENRLQPHWDTFRDLLQPGQKEEWRLTLSKPDGTPADANLMVALYDASLDYFVPHRWDFSIYRGHRTYSVPYLWKEIEQPNVSASAWYYQKVKDVRSISLSEIDDAIFNIRVYEFDLYSSRAVGASGVRMLKSAAMPVPEMRVEEGVVTDNAPEEDAKESAEEPEAETLPSVTFRENFDETAFFYPQLRTDEKGQVSIAFTLPESLTRWNLIGVAHTRDLMYTTLGEQIEARKDLMAQLYLPRFLRPGDEAMLTATARNVSEQPQRGKGLMQILDAKTEKVLRKWKVDIDLPANKDTVFHFPYEAVNGEYNDLIIRWGVEGTTCSDGEQRLLPILPATQHVTNTIQITAYDPGVTQFDLSTLFPQGVSDRKLTLEYTTHPEQYALQALPVLAKAKHCDVLSLATAYYAGALGKKLGVEMPDSTEEYLSRVRNLQDANGGFRWYPGMPTSPYLTREVSYLFTRLCMLTRTTNGPWSMVNDKAVHYLLAQRIDSTYLSTADLRMLYIVQYSGVRLSKDEQKKVDFLLKLAKRDDIEEEGYERQALLAIVLKQAGADRKAKKCVEQFRQRLVSSPEHGTYIEFPKGSFVSIDRKLHIHVQLMEALQRMNPQDTLLRGMRRYLLQQKRTQEWSTPVNSANAVFALMQGEMVNGKMVNGEVKDLLALTRQRTTIQNFTAQDDTLGYLCDSMEIADGKLPVKLRLQKFWKGESWGGIFADFEQDYDKVTAHSEGLSIRQEYPTQAKTGSRYTVRYYLSADRDYEYVTLIVPRPAFTEPVNQRSGYGWSHSTLGWNGDLFYYRQVHDATTEFSFYQVPRGDYLIEETLYVERDGRYHSGVAVIRCEYAEEFQGHSDDKVIKVGK